MTKQFIIRCFVYLLLVLSCGCSNIKLNARYSPDKNNSDTNGIYKIKIDVIDKRKDELLGITEGLFRRKIVLDRPATGVFEEGFRKALTLEGFDISDDADKTLRVSILSLQAFRPTKSVERIRAEGSLDLTLASSDSHIIGSKQFEETVKEDESNISNDVRDMNHALATLIRRLIDKAVLDIEMRSLYDNNGVITYKGVASRYPREKITCKRSGELLRYVSTGKISIGIDNEPTIHIERVSINNDEFEGYFVNPKVDNMPFKLKLSDLSSKVSESSLYGIKLTTTEPLFFIGTKFKENAKFTVNNELKLVEVSAWDEPKTVKGQNIYTNTTPVGEVKEEQKAPAKKAKKTKKAKKVKTKEE